MDHILGSFAVRCACMCWANYKGIGLNRFGGIFVAALVCQDNIPWIHYLPWSSVWFVHVSEIKKYIPFKNSLELAKMKLVNLHEGWS